MPEREGPPERRENEFERADRNLNELLQELRVALPGVQVLFAFLLTVPFSNRFTELTPFQEKLYFGILLSAALTTVLFVAPTANHRLLFHKRDKAHVVIIANRLTVAGLAVLATSMCGVIALISDFLFGVPAAAVATILAGAAFANLWFVQPLLRRRRLEDLPPPK